MKNKKDLLRIKLCALALSSALETTLVGCSENRESATNENVDHLTLDQTNTDDIENGVTQVLQVPNNDFSLVVNYKFDLLDNEKWTLCDDKNIIMEICTKNLKKGMKVYIDNVHTDTSVMAYENYFNGILQDTMDDRIHNSLMQGFPISNSVSYVGTNHIEGQNDSFIAGFTYGLGGYLSSGSVYERRRLESDYLSHGVYANKISSVIDLIIVNEDEVTSCVSVSSSLVVPIWPFVKFIKKDEEYYNYYYEENGKAQTKKISLEEYYFLTNNSTQKRILK